MQKPKSSLVYEHMVEITKQFIIFLYLFNNTECYGVSAMDLARDIQNFQNKLYKLMFDLYN